MMSLLNMAPMFDNLLTNNTSVKELLYSIQLSLQQGLKLMQQVHPRQDNMSLLFYREGA